METITIRDVDALPMEHRRSLEALLRHPLEPGQHVVITTYRPAVEPDEVRRWAAHAALVRELDAAHAHAEARGITAEEADAAVDEAMRHVRPGYLAP